MSWTVSDRFPSWGETGESPADGFFYEGGDQVNEKHLDYLWNSIRGLENDVQAALDDIDTDSDGIVDEADIANALNSTEVGDGLDGGDGTALSVDVSDFAGSGLQDDGAQNLQLTDDSITINGDTVSLGGSTTIPTYGDSDAISAINNDSDHGSTAPHNYYTDSEAVNAVDGSSLSSLDIGGMDISKIPLTKNTVRKESPFRTRGSQSTNSVSDVTYDSGQIDATNRKTLFMEFNVSFQYYIQIKLYIDGQKVSSLTVQNPGDVGFKADVSKKGSMSYEVVFNVNSDAAEQPSTINNAEYYFNKSVADIT